MIADDYYYLMNPVCAITSLCLPDVPGIWRPGSDIQLQH